ncbi:MAG TPA: Uma2 family endonuclease [Chthoniobacter sp.]|jgi:Uma2 family endonuclease
MNALHDLPIIKNQSAFNLARWAELCADPLWIDVEGKIETDRHGQIIMNAPADPSHGGRQADLTLLLSKFAPAGKIIVECPISTREGVKVPDVVWVSKRRIANLGRKSAFTAAPEICIEVLSASNTRNEIEEKRRLYFEAGASEVWLCERDGRMRFFQKANPSRAARQSPLCPEMPGKILD